ncbi:hypothetical protein H112_00851 [Trichophyton rubrum D6]|uniref:BZIP domain-containing protein n=2 Tax=Trichophyton rubrum TaxID=5551 RepID=F2SZI7_TRIRC|nr:uncharacterized protein TERG_07957 [Trichophyton rubrum CBS 118892]EZF27146.1 hypothetical protein H100_00849 [Trichophyton rubrum MR850]EZF46135.1 hypothetical protein H102_00841 [Trichophyton rubrum CBS 100081]EZF56751.1 hypothetical protein H103_00849 [Trichophyton rubrum CBS 288.86]EZF67392.1 hypothetical protein H104_00833 [Trichophyton rubrum CBS 289.86]EZF88716.1 hypothetical protein H110_00849 [Trichophyton rubrum MR1448]EZF99548.1 hypothetical protein H113_00850 [Trichophyton rubr
MLKGENTTEMLSGYLVSFQQLRRKQIINSSLGQRRKEHIRNLERAQNERISNQTDVIEHLRLENLELRKENESLSRLRSNCSSPSMLSVTVPSHSSSGEPSSLITMSDSISNKYFPRVPEAPPDTTYPTSSSIDELSRSLNRLCIFSPYDINRMRSYLHLLFHPVLSLVVDGTPLDTRIHFLALASLGPSLPPSLQPTTLQLQVPHNVYVDLIPSPSLRDVLLRSDPAMVAAFLVDVCTFACDIDDRGQLIIWGEDFLNEISWEFSVPVLEKWGGWFLPSIWHERADFWRRHRSDSFSATG